MRTRFCVILDPIYPDGETSDLHAYFTPDDPELPVVLGSTGVASAPVFETDEPFARLEEIGFPRDAKKTTERVHAAPGFPVMEESDPFGF